MPAESPTVAKLGDVGILSPVVALAILPYGEGVVFLLCLWIVGGLGFAFAAAAQIVTVGLNETDPFFVIFLIAYGLSWIVIVKNKKVNSWLRSKL